MSKSNGWRDGRDPIQRWLRAVTVIVVLGVFVYLTILWANTPRAEHDTETIVVIALALGAALVLLGYEGIVRMPIIGRGKEDDDE